MSKKQPNNIERREIPQVALDLGIEQQYSGLLMFTSSIGNYGRILRRPFRSSHYSLIFALHGEASLKINMFDYVISGNRVLFASPSAIKEFKSISEDCMLTVILFTDGYVVNSSLNQAYNDVFNLFISRTHFFVNISADFFDDLKLLTSLLDKRLKKSTTESKVSNLIFFTLINLLGEALNNQDEVLPRETKSKSGNLVLHFFQLLPKHIRQHRELQFYAGLLNVNSKYLSHTLKEKTGKTASALIADMVVLEARVLLSSPNYSIAKVSEELGFTDQFTFSKYFKHNTGFTPSQYRAKV